MYLMIYIKFVIFVQYGIVVFFFNYVVVNEFEEISRMVGP